MTSIIGKENKLASNILNFQAFRENGLTQLCERNKELRINRAAGFLLASIFISLLSERIVCHPHVDHQGDPHGGHHGDHRGDYHADDHGDDHGRFRGERKKPGSGGQSFCCHFRSIFYLK